MQFLKTLRRFVEERYPNTLLLAEANQWPEDVVQYFGEGDEFHMGYQLSHHAAFVHGAATRGSPAHR